MATKETLKGVPGFSVVVRENSAVRMVKLAQPICPHSKVEMTTTPEGRQVPKRDRNPDRQNCQEMGHGWWKQCEAKGHNPYFTNRVWYEDVEEVDPETQEVKVKKRKHGGNPCPACGQNHLYPNVSQVAANLRINGGKGPEFKMERHGFKRLRDIGYNEVCQYRNCQYPIKVTSRVGQYCSKLHAALIGADLNEEFLHYTTGRFEGGPSENKLLRARAKQLIEASEFIQVQDV